VFHYSTFYSYIIPNTYLTGFCRKCALFIFVQYANVLIGEPNKKSSQTIKYTRRKLSCRWQTTWCCSAERERERERDRTPQWPQAS